MKRIRCVAIVDHYRQTDENQFSGNPVNIAVYTQRLDGHASYVGTVGADSRGVALLDDLRNEARM